MGASTFDELNKAPTAEAAERLHACNASRRWVGAVLAGRPYQDMASLLAAAEDAARSLEWSDVQEALDSHPRIGERPSDDSTESAWSRQEQAAVGKSSQETQQALYEGNAEYEKRFGHVFLVRAASRTAEEMLAELRRRLDNDEISERAEVTEELAQITRLRLERLLAE